MSDDRMADDFGNPDDRQAVVAGRLAELAARERIHDKIAAEMPELSHLECMSCGYRREVGDVAGKLRNGWPTCCNGHAMRLFTVAEVEA